MSIDNNLDCLIRVAHYGGNDDRVCVLAWPSTGAPNEMQALLFIRILLDWFTQELRYRPETYEKKDRDIAIIKHPDNIIISKKDFFDHDLLSLMSKILYIPSETLLSVNSSRRIEHDLYLSKITLDQQLARMNEKREQKELIIDDSGRIFAEAEECLEECRENKARISRLYDDMFEVERQQEVLNGKFSYQADRMSEQQYYQAEDERFAKEVELDGIFVGLRADIAENRDAMTVLILKHFKQVQELLKKDNNQSYFLQGSQILLRILDFYDPDCYGTDSHGNLIAIDWVVPSDLHGFVIGILNEYVDTHPNSVEGLYELAKVCRGNCDQAMINIDKAIALGQDEAKLYDFKGLLFLDLIKPESAIQMFDKAIMLDQADLLTYLGHKELALDMQYEINYALENNESYEFVKEKFCEDDGFKVESGIKIDMREDVTVMYERALQDINNLLRNDINNAIHYRNKGLILEKLGRNEEANKMTKIVVELNGETATVSEDGESEERTIEEIPF